MIEEYSGTITNVEATSAHVRIQLDTTPGKTLTWLMTQFIHKPRPEVGKRLLCTARPGPHDQLIVQQLISISDAPKQAVHTEVGKSVDIKVGKTVSTETDVDPTLLPLPSDASLLERLAERILKLKAMWKDKFALDMVAFKWEVGHEISVSRRETSEASYRELEAKTGIDHVELFRCVKFFEKFPKHDYEVQAWRKVVAELPASKEPTSEAKPAFIIDEITHWTCPECGVKFQHFHNANGKHGLREVE
jgi:hypothetical protein